jgi:hypothetical protein
VGNVEEGSPHDECGNVGLEEKSFEGQNPKHVSGMKQGCTDVEEQPPESVRNARRGRHFRAGT